MFLLSVLAIQGTGFIEPQGENTVYLCFQLTDHTDNSSVNEPQINNGKREKKKKIKN